MKINITNPGVFRAISRNLETLQAFKAPLVNTFEKLICGGYFQTAPEYAEFSDISPIDEAGDQAKLEKVVTKFLKETEATEDNIAEAFYKLAGLLDKFETEQKRDLVTYTLNKN